MGDADAADDQVLADGDHDVFVIDAEPLGDEGDGAGLRLDLTVVAGERKGEVVTITAHGLGGSVFDLIGMPGTLTVADGAPSFRLDG